MAGKMSIVLFSGQEDRLMAAATIVSGAVMNDMEVSLFFTFWGLGKALKHPLGQPELSTSDPALKEMVFAVMKKKNVPTWLKTLKDAKELGSVKVYGCAMFSDLMEIKKADIDPVIDEIIGVNEFIIKSEGAQIIFI